MVWSIMFINLFVVVIHQFYCGCIDSVECKSYVRAEDNLVFEEEEEEELEESAEFVNGANEGDGEEEN